MAFDAGSVSVRLDALFDERGFDQYDRAIKAAKAHKDVTTELHIKTDVSGGDRYTKALKDVEEHHEKTIRGNARLRTSFGTVWARGGAAFAAAGGAYALVNGVKSVVGAYEESLKISKQTEAVLRSTGGAAHVTAKQVGDLATAISKKTGVDDEAIQSGENLLLTFTGIRNESGKGNDIFNQTTKIMTDMSAAMGTDAKGSAIQLGKALNDPAKGLTALTRVGVTFTDQQKEQIKTLTASGKKVDAQKIILRELRKEFGGSAAAQATATDKLKVSLGNLQEAIGKRLEPIIAGAARGLTKLTDALSGGSGAAGSFGRNVNRVFKGIGDTVGGVFKFVKSVINENSDTFASMGKSFRSIGNSIGRIVRGIGQAFSSVFGGGQGDGVKKDIRSTIRAVLDIQDAVLKFVAAVVRRLAPGIKEAFQGAFTVIRGAIKIISGILHGDFAKMWDGVKDIFGGALKVLGGMIRAATAPFREAAARIGKALKNAFDDGWDAVKSVFRAAFRYIMGKFSDFGQDAKNIAKRIGGFIGHQFSEAWDAIRKALASEIRGWARVLGGAKSILGNVAKGVGEFVVNKFIDGFNAVGSKTAGLLKAIIGVINKVPIIPDIKTSGLTWKNLGHVDFKAQGGKIGAPTVVMGEEAPRHPEWVIATNPAYREKNLSHWAAAGAALGVQGFARGGFVQGADSSHLSSKTRAFAQKMFSLGYNVTDAYRPGGPTEHGAGTALDFGDSVNNLVSLWRLLFPKRGSFNQLLGPPGLYNGRNRFFDAGLQAQHNDHIHVGLGGGGGALGNIIGALGSIVNFGGKAFSSAGGLIKGVIGKFPDNPLTNVMGGAFKDMGGYILKKAASWVTGKVKSAWDKITPSIDLSAGPGGGSVANRKLGRLMMAKYFADSQWPALDRLWYNESKWDTFADNPSSDAYGIPQALPGSKMGFGWQNDPAVQIRWGLRYIKDRYGSPSRALAAWQARSPHWYQRGGWLGHEGDVGHDGIHIIAAPGEAVLNRHQVGYVNKALARTFGMNLNDLFAKVKTPHWAGRASGGPVYAASGHAPNTNQGSGNISGGGGIYGRIRAMRKTQGTRIKEYDKLEFQVGRKEHDYEIKDRQYGRSEEVLIDEDTGLVNHAAVDKRVRELNRLMEIRHAIIKKLGDMRRVAKRVIKTYSTIIDRLRRSLKHAKKKERGGIKASIKSYQSERADWKGKSVELGDTIDSEREDYKDSAKERDEVAATKSAPVEAPTPDDGGSTGGGDTGGGDTSGGGTDTPAPPTPEQIAEAVFQEFQSFNDARGALFSGFGSNFMTGAGAASMDNLMMQAGAKYYGAVPAQNALSAGVIGSSGGQTVVNQTNNFPTPPPDPHTWAKQTQFELRTI